MFRLPRKIKKKLSQKVFFYPPNNDGSRLIARPKSSQDDYNAYKTKLLTDIFDETKAERKAKSLIWDMKFKTPVIISSEELLVAVNEIFAEEFRDSSYSLLLRAKEHPIAIEDYYIFVNAWLITKKGDNHANTACMSIDGIIKHLKK